MRVARIYDVPAPDAGRRVLVDRLWPRGVRRAGAPIDAWEKEAAPSTELRRWYGHEPERFAAFAARYADELGAGAARAALERLRADARAAPLVLVTATRDLEHSGAAVLADLVRHPAP